MSNAVKDSKNPFFKSSYADLNSVREAVLPALNNNGISVLQFTITENGKSFVRTTLLHISGEYLCSDTEILSSKANDAQAMGSAISYARRYGLQALLCVGAVDDDAESTMNRPQSIPAKKVTQEVNKHVAFEELMFVTEAPEIPVASKESAKNKESPKSFSRKNVAKTPDEDDI
jgi:hypothetical protein